jgi:23S rRNA (adenine2503-C2)-methyltransferase
MNIWDTKKIDSEEGNVRKYVFSNDKAVAEAVLYRYPTYTERTVICCSTQSGCPVGCRFCGAGNYFVRSLSGSEIVAQVEQCIADTEIDPRDMKRLQIMFMSMGEPLLNKKGMLEALPTLHSLYPNAKLLISSIAPRIDWDWVMEISREIPAIGLQFSIHKSTDEQRNELIPFKNKLSLAEIALTGQQWFLSTDRKPFINYCAGEDNSSEQDADNLLALFDPKVFECTVSVICERNEGMPARNDHQIELARAFSEKMLNRSYNVRVFDPAGQDDIGGGCGQLWFVQDWMRNNPDLARPSCGNGLPSVHTPVGA